MLLLDAIDSWASAYHDQTELEIVEEGSSRKCALANKDAVTTQFVKYRGVELIVFESPSNAPII